MFEKLNSIFLEVTIDVLSPNWSDFRTYSVHASATVSYASTELDLPKK